MDPKRALFQVLKAQLDNVSPWGVRVFAAGRAPAKTARPYVLYFSAGGGPTIVTPWRRSATFILSVKVVDTSMANALVAREAFNDLLDNSGENDTDPRLPASATWRILTVTAGREIEIPEYVENAETVYHCGFQYEFTMEAK